MFKIVAAGIAAFLLLCGCASSPPPEPADDAGGASTAEMDSLQTASYEELFLDMHVDILQLIDRSADDPDSIMLIEARSIVTIAEEMYLEGNVPLAVQLLREAALLLRQTP